MWEQAREVLSESFGHVLTSATSILPGVLAFLLILLLSVALAWILRTALRRSLTKLDFDRCVVRWGLSELADWAPSRSPTLLLAGVAYWSIILLGVLTGVGTLSATLSSQLTLGMLAVLRVIATSLIVLLVGIVIARFLARGVLITAVNMQIQSARLLSLGAKWLVLVFAGAMALEHLEIGHGMVRLAFGILFGGIVLALALAVGLGSKDMVTRSGERQTSRSEEQAK